MLLTSSTKVGLGIMWVPPTHQPPLLQVAKRLMRLTGSLRVSRMYMGASTAPAMPTCRTQSRANSHVKNCLHRQRLKLWLSHRRYQEHSRSTVSSVCMVFIEEELWSSKVLPLLLFGDLLSKHVSAHSSLLSSAHGMCSAYLGDLLRWPHIQDTPAVLDQLACQHKLIAGDAEQASWIRMLFAQNAARVSHPWMRQSPQGRHRTASTIDQVT